MAAQRKVFLFTTDISKYVIDVDQVVVSTGEFGQLTANDITTMTGNSIKGFWDMNNPASPFYGAVTFEGYTVTIQIDDVVVFIGDILNLDADNATSIAAITLRSALQVFLETAMIYESEALESPSTAIRNIATEFGIAFDFGSFVAADSVYALNNVEIEVVMIEPFTKAIDLIQTILDIGVAKLYALNGVLFYEVYQPATQPSLFEFSDDHLGVITIFSHPISGNVQKDKVNGYAIEIVDTPGRVTFGFENQQSKQISAGADALVRIISVQTGVWVGETWLAYLNQPQQRIEFGVPTNYGKSLPLGSAVTIDYTQQGWNPIIIDLIQIDNTTRVISTIVGLTR